MGTLIIPCAGRSTRFPMVRPKWLLTYPDGKLMVEKAVEGLNMPFFKRVIVTMLEEHRQKYSADTVVAQAFGGKAEVCVLDGFTQSQSETVAVTIRKMGVTGPFVSKDSDGYVRAEIDRQGNFLVGVDIRKKREVRDVGAKSFIVLEGQRGVADIVEKSAVSNIICTGVYGFDSAEKFVKAYEEVKSSWQSGKGEIYLSNIVSHLIGRRSAFTYHEAAEYEDWGLLSDWYRVLRRKRTYFVDVDGVIFKNKGRYGQVNWDSEDEPLSNNICVIKKWAEQGAQVVLCTSRPEKHRGKLEESLERHGIRWHSIVMGCNHAQRVLVNDFARTNPHPSCVAVSIPRDADDLDKYIGAED
ncbi:MAG: hypothetical protein HY891_06150 [Deltaproteobacteria bacterium]|nr:hypothetical protein [Deltaproteobacteria bacterium]